MVEWHSLFENSSFDSDWLNYMTKQQLELDCEMINVVD